MQIDEANGRLVLLFVSDVGAVEGNSLVMLW